jgi:hypothetical protein
LGNNEIVDVPDALAEAAATPGDEAATPTPVSAVATMQATRTNRRER